MTINLQLSLSQEALMVRREPQSLILVLDLLPTGEVKGGQPLNIGFVLDRSDSMNDENKIDLLREAMQHAIGLLRPEDQAFVVTFNSRSQILATKAVNEETEELKKKIIELKADDGTKLSEGMREAQRLIEGQSDWAHTNQLVILTDGQTDKDEDYCVEIAEELSSRSWPISAYGLGTDWNSDLLEKLAHVTSGEAVALLSADEMDTAFQRRVSAAQQTIAKNVKMELRPVKGVKVQAVARWGVEDVTFEKDPTRPVELRTVSAPGGTRVGIEIEIPPFDIGRQKLLDFRGTYYTPSREQRELAQEVVVTFTSNAAEIRPNPSSDIAQTVRYFRLIREKDRILHEYQDSHMFAASDDGIHQCQEALKKLIPALESVGAQGTAEIQRVNIEKMGRREQVIRATKQFTGTLPPSTPPQDAG